MPESDVPISKWGPQRLNMIGGVLEKSLGVVSGIDSVVVLSHASTFGVRVEVVVYRAAAREVSPLIPPKSVKFSTREETRTRSFKLMNPIL